MGESYIEIVAECDEHDRPPGTHWLSLRGAPEPCPGGSRVRLSRQEAIDLLVFQPDLPLLDHPDAEAIIDLILGANREG